MQEKNKSLSYYPGHIKKARDEIKQKIKLVDLVYIVLDSRIPISSLVDDINELILDKPRIYIFTKYDLCDKNKTDNIINNNYKDGIIYKCDLINNFNKNKLIDLTYKKASSLLEKRKNKGIINNNLKIMVIGIPNCGKSTLINKIATKNKVKAENRAGVTRQLSWIKVTDSIEMIDTPGILWPRFENEKVFYNIASIGSINPDSIDKNTLIVKLVSYLKDNYKNVLEERYKIEIVDDIDELIERIAKSRGCIKGDFIDYDKVYDIILNDIKTGRIKNITLDD